MSTVCITWENAHLHGEAWISHHRLRYRIFVERQGWAVPTYNGLEYDEFDTPAARYILWLDSDNQARAATRLLQTTRPFMIKKLWPHLVHKPLPEGPSIWEATRFCCDRTLEPRLRRKAIAELICGCQEFGVANGVQKYLGVMPPWIFKHVIGAAGCPVTFLGPVSRVDGGEIVAAQIEVSADVLTAVRATAGIIAPMPAQDLCLVA
jgi:N-acyl-L-homoserine lactone synthetase